MQHKKGFVAQQTFKNIILSEISSNDDRIKAWLGSAKAWQLCNADYALTAFIIGASKCVDPNLKDEFKAGLKGKSHKQILEVIKGMLNKRVSCDNPPRDVIIGMFTPGTALYDFFGIKFMTDFSDKSLLGSIFTWLEKFDAKLAQETLANRNKIECPAILFRQLKAQDPLYTETSVINMNKVL